MNIPITICTSPESRLTNHPVELGMPLPRGAFKSLSGLKLYTLQDELVPCDLSDVLRWADGSVRWAMLRFLASEKSFVLRPSTSPVPKINSTLRLWRRDDDQHIETGVASFVVNADWLRIRYGDLAATRAELLVDSQKRAYRFQVDSCDPEHLGDVSLVLLLKGRFVDRRNNAFCHGECRLSFWAGTALIRMEFTLWNPRAAKHKGGLWDLGDPGSVFFRSFHLCFDIAQSEDATFYLSASPGDQVIESQSDPLSIHQSSSGGPNWKGLTHVDKDNQPTPKFKGCRLSHGAAVHNGVRANPAVAYRSRNISAAFALEDFWQRFPNRLEIEKGCISIEPFPAADAQDFELQGGEKSTFRLWADFGLRELSEAVTPARICTAPVVSSGFHHSCNSILGLPSTPESVDPCFAQYIRTAVDGPNSLFDRRESYDEYGWRDFGDLPADHEEQHFSQQRPLVSHYNNQYDLIQGFLTQFALHGDIRWFELARDLARHVMDHDIYHTDRDKSAYNGGYFWHTAHYLHAGTATHRTFSRLAADPLPPVFGGGPSNEHNYTTGLMYYYLLTGDARAKDAVVQLASWVDNMQDGWKTPFRYLSRNLTGLATCTAENTFQGPGRGGAYSINACLDAFVLTADAKWLSIAGHFMRTCIHPSDDPSAMNLLNREGRWSYVVFLQVLGKYLDVHMDAGGSDEDFQFGREALLRYARWMTDAEYPYLDRPEELEYPSSTWAAQELRKSCVFLLARKYGSSAESVRFEQQAVRFFSECQRYLMSFADRMSLRNIAIVLFAAPAYFRLKEETATTAPIPPSVQRDFGERMHLLPQKVDALRRMKRVVATCGLAGVVELCRYLRDRFVRGKA